MQRIEWRDEFDIGIGVIDAQHRRIVDYMNTLADHGAGDEQGSMAELLEALLDYTFSHFAFEEALMEEAGYDSLYVHQRTHEAFGRRIKDLHAQFNEGEDVSEQLGGLLQTWLLDHIQSDDQSYGPLVRKKFTQLENKSGGNWISQLMRRCFDKY